MKKILWTGAAVLAVTVSFATGAKAQCFWNGYGWNCGTAPMQPYYSHYSQPYAQPYTSYNPYYPQPSTGTSNPEITGYKPAWEPSLPGPKAGPGAGR